jgi:hypothetical protein
MVTTRVDRTGSPVASIATDRAQGLISGAGVKGPCYLATTANITLAGEQTIDGVAATAGKRVLVKDQTTASQNGIWLVATGDWVRAPDFYSNDSVREGTRVFVTDGTVSGGTEYAVTTPDPISIGSTSITFAFSSSVLSTAQVAAALLGVINSATDTDFADADYLIARRNSDGVLIKRSWANVKVLIRTALGALIAAMTAKTTPVDADTIAIADSAASSASKKVTLTSLWTAYLKAKADALYQPIATILTTLAALANGSGYLSNNGAGALSWATPSAGGMTLLSTLTTTSGATASLTSIPAGYRSLYCEIDGVSCSGSGALRVATSSTNGAAYGSNGDASGTTAGNIIEGVVEILNISSTRTSAKVARSSLRETTGPFDRSVANVACPSNTAAVVDAIQFSWSTGNFDAGTIRVYGVR